ncbi:uncharacterized protein [Antedon mediterranea]|uniref:uncharacterized protein n=1 Tax=Antedon mediterranea TaxID=105859 RepID=UPI003AF72D2D
MNLYKSEHCGDKLQTHQEFKFLRCQVNVVRLCLDLNSGWSRHLGEYTEETPYECVHCGKKFNQNDDLKKHMRIHTGEKPYECEHCGKKFNQNDDLKKHMRIHKEETPYECENCGKKFKDNDDLKKHLRMHTGEKPYECEHCGKKFNQSDDLKRHMRIHTGEKPYECEHYQGPARNVSVTAAAQGMLEARQEIMSWPPHLMHSSHFLKRDRRI